MSERGFTLIEVVVTAGIIALLATATVAWMLGMHPGALAQATRDYDAAMGVARAIAMTDGNGATLAFLARPSGEGFLVRVYRGRPSDNNSVKPTTSMDVVADAGVAERTFGKPPFAIFLSASGYVSGRRSYPVVDASGALTFPAIASEPPCPAGGLLLTFTGPQNATATRALPCTASITGTRAPNPSPTPNAPVVSPATLVYHWPADARQSFVATEWGYTHWFATTTGFECGNGIATYPDVLPSPYASPYTAEESDAPPSRPPHTPYSYPNSSGGSMNDAPAPFPIDPASEGVCLASVADDYGQQANVNVQVMGWLTATYARRTFSHLSQPELAFPNGTFDSRGAAVTIGLSKTFDAERLQPQVWLDSVCASYLSATTDFGSTPNAPSTTPATASVTLTATAKPPTSTLTCGGLLYDQYNGSQNGEGVPFDVALGSIASPEIWPPAVQYAVSGQSLIPPASCTARPYTDTTFQTISNPPGWTNVTLDANNCYDGSIYVRELGWSGLFSLNASEKNSCLSAGYLIQGLFSNSGEAPGPDALTASPTSATTGTNSHCVMEILGDPQSLSPVVSSAVEVVCATTLGAALSIGSSCTFAIPPTRGDEPCKSGGDGSGGSQLQFFPSFHPVTDPKLPPAPGGGGPNTLTYLDGSTTATFTKGQPQSVMIYVIEAIISAKSTVAGCADDIQYLNYSSLTFT